MLGVSRLVPRKGFDVVIDASRRSRASGATACSSRSRARAATGNGSNAGRRADVQFLGRVPDADLPALYACADVFAMCCRDRWRGLEAEGFGIVFLEAAACGVPAVAGRSGGSHEAVVDGETGYVVEPRDVGAVRAALARLLGDDPSCGRAWARPRAQRATGEFSYDRLVGAPRAGRPGRPLGARPLPRPVAPVD